MFSFLTQGQVPGDSCVPGGPQHIQCNVSYYFTLLIVFKLLLFKETVPPDWYQQIGLTEDTKYWIYNSSASFFADTKVLTSSSLCPYLLSDVFDFKTANTSTETVLPACLCARGKRLLKTSTMLRIATLFHFSYSVCVQVFALF